MLRCRPSSAVACLFLLSGSLLGAQAPPASLTGDLLKHGTFEQVDSNGAPIGWRGEGLLVPGVKVGVVAADSGRAGKYALRLHSETTPAQVASFTGPFPVHAVAGAEIELSCFYRTRGTPGGYLDLDTYAEPFAEKGWQTPYLTMEQHGLEETNDWRLLTWRMRCPAEAVEAVLIVGATGEGDVMLDDVSVRPVEAPVRMEPLSLGTLTGWPARRVAYLRVINGSADMCDLRVNVAAYGAQAGPRRTQVLRLPAGSREEVTVPYDLPTKDSHWLAVSLDDAKQPGIYDALTAEVPALLAGRIVQPNFRGTLLSSIPAKEIIVEGTIAAAEALCSELALEAELGGAGVVGRDGQGITRPDGPWSWRLAIPREGMLTGTYRLTVSALRQGKPVGSLALDLSRAAPGPTEVGFDADGRVLMNGKAVFVNGLCNVTEQDDLAGVAKAGFNLIVVPSGKAGGQFLEIAQSQGLMAVVYSPIPAAHVAGPAPSFWEHTVQKHGGRPGVLGWQLQGAPDSALVRLAPFIAQQAEMARIDPYHPTVTRLTVPSLLPLYAPWCDIVAFESQPVPALPVTRVVEDLAAARAAARPGQPVWSVIQATGRAWLVQGGGLEQGAAGRPPTGAEHRAMTLLAVAHGAQGLLHHGFSFGAVRDRDAYHLPRDGGDLWEGMQATNAILAPLHEALAAGVFRGVEVTGPVHVGAWDYQGRLLVLAVNSQASAALTTFAVPGGAPDALHRLDDGSEVLKTVGNRFADDLPAYGGRAYVTTLAAP